MLKQSLMVDKWSDRDHRKERIPNAFSDFEVLFAELLTLNKKL